LLELIVNFKNEKENFRMKKQYSVLEYIQKQNAHQKEIIEKLREIILKNFTDIKETGMAEGIWYQEKFYIAAFKDHVNLGVSVYGLSQKEKNNFLGSGKKMRHLKFYSSNDIDERALFNLLDLVWKNTKSEKHCKINKV
jgi:hypothetical protein